MILAKAEKLYQKLIQEIEGLKDENKNPRESASLFLPSIISYNNRLKELLLSTTFSDVDEEIIFFKTVKPKFISLQLYYLSLEELELNRPKGSRKLSKKFYENELRKIDTFYGVNRNILNYYHSGSRQLDVELFVRGAVAYPSWLVRQRADVDERFSTVADHLFSQIIAAEKTYSHIAKALSDLEGAPTLKENDVLPTNCKWTGESINLVEIAYGIWLTGQMNNGNATISEIIRWLESSLGINIGRAYRRWTEISRRDQTTTTKYLDRMKDAINIRLVNEDDLKRQKRNSSKNKNL